MRVADAGCSGNRARATAVPRSVCLGRGTARQRSHVVVLAHLLLSRRVAKYGPSGRRSQSRFPSIPNSPQVSVKVSSPSFSIEVTTLSPGLSQTCLSLG